MNRNILVLIIACFLLFGCKGEKDNERILKQYIDFDSLQQSKDQAKLDSMVIKNCKTFFEYNKEGSLTKIKSTLDNRQYGHFFQFTDLGIMKNYFFLIGDSIHNSLEIVKNLSSENCIEKGTPFVDYMENETDSVHKKYSLLFSQFPRKNLSVSLSTNGRNYSNIILHNSALMPLLKEADIFFSRSINKIFLKIDANELNIRLRGLRDKQIFYDTIKF
ncbi:MAG: hypothetical protein M3004_00475 [Bacteroidota bacterium]|nr:hypothetical protein [Bacteroidota bacterium]